VKGGYCAVSHDYTGTKRFGLKKVSLLLYGMLLVVLFFSTQTYFGTNNYKRIYLLETVFIAVYIVFLIAVGGGVLRCRRKEAYTYAVFLLPYAALFAVSAAECLLLKKITYTAMIRYSVQPLLICMMAVLTYSMFRRRAVQAIFAASVINYSVYIITCISKYGFLSVFDAGSDNEASRLLEVHEITFVFGLLAVYLWITKSGAFRLQEKHQKFWLVTTVLLSLLGFKRILAAVMIVMILINALLKRQKTPVLLMFATVMSILFCLIWCILCSSPIVMEWFGTNLGINLKGRNWIYANFYPYYELSATYIGGGIGYVQSMIGSMKNMFLLGHFIGFHNEILRLYIDLGCIPFLLYLTAVFPAAVYVILKHHGYRSAVCYYIFWMMTVFCSATDNLMTYPNYMLVFITITIHCMMEESIPDRSVDYENSSRNSL